MDKRWQAQILAGFIWDSGIIRSFTNTATGSDILSIEDAGILGVASHRVEDGTLRNEGRILHRFQNVQLAQDGIINNVAGGVYEFTNSGGISLTSGSNGQFLNSGTILKSDSGISSINANLTSTNRVEATNGTLRLINIADLSNVVRSDRTLNASAEVELGFSGSTNHYGDVEFQLVNGAEVQFLSGSHNLNGTFTSSGSGQTETTSQSTIFNVAPSATATFDFAPGAPFLAGAFGDPLFDIQGQMLNLGTMNCSGMRLQGTFINRDSFNILSSGTLDISDISGSSMGTFQNNGAFNFHGSSNVRVQQNGLLLNNGADGSNPLAGTVLFDGSSMSVTTNDTSTTTHFRNRSLIQNANGNTTISVNYEQPVAGAELRVERNSLTLRDFGGFECRNDFFSLPRLCDQQHAK